MCHSSEPNYPLTGDYEAWAICADDSGYPSDLYGSPWYREVHTVTTVTPGVWNSYTISPTLRIYSTTDPYFWVITILMVYGYTAAGYHPLYHGFDTDSWYGRSFCNLGGYYDWAPVTDAFGEGEWMFRIYGDDCLT
jgi:hypothetical protein